MYALFNQMLDEGMRPSGRFLAFLLSHASSLETGLSYLWHSHLPLDHVRALTNFDALEQHASIIDSLPDYLFAAFIRLLCRHAWPIFEDDVLSRTSPAPSIVRTARMSEIPLHSHTLISQNRKAVNPLSHAFELMRYRKSQYRPPWNDVLATLCRVGGRTPSDSPVLSTWRLMTRVVHQMQCLDVDLDFKGLQNICVGLEKAILASQRRSSIAFCKTGKVDEVLWDGVKLVKREFERLVATSSRPFDPNSRQICSENEAPLDPTTLIPRMLSIPDPAHLHALIRVLGLAGDYDGLLLHLRWLSRFQPELQAAIEERANGTRMIRRSLIAARVFLERSWRRDAHDDGFGGSLAASQDIVQSAHDTMEEMAPEQWGGWPSDEDIESYVEKGLQQGRFPS